MVVHAQVELGDRGSDGRRGHPAVGFKGQGGSRWGVLHGPHWWPRLPGVGRVVAGLPAVWLVTLSVAPLGHAAAGDLDRSFGKHGKVRTNFGGGSAEAMALVLQPDGKLVAAGTTLARHIGDFALVRYQGE